MSCQWLIENSRSRIGYYCGSGAPCRMIAIVSYDCPCIEYAREFEAAILTDEYWETRKRLVQDAINDVSVTR